MFNYSLELMIVYLIVTVMLVTERSVAVNATDADSLGTSDGISDNATSVGFISYVGDLKIEDANYMVRFINDHYNISCAGAIVQDVYVSTTAYCANQNNNTGGTWFGVNLENMASLVDYYFSDSFRNENPATNGGGAKLKSSLKFNSTLNKIDLRYKPAKEGEVLMVVWYDFKPEEDKPALKSGTVKILSNEDCDKVLNVSDTRFIGLVCGQASFDTRTPMLGSPLVDQLNKRLVGHVAKNSNVDCPVRNEFCKFIFLDLSM